MLDGVWITMGTAKLFAKEKRWPFCWYTPFGIFRSSKWIHYGDVIMGKMISKITSLTIVYSTVYSGADQNKNIKVPHHWPLCRNSPGTCEFPAQMASNAENVSIWWRLHDNHVIFIGYDRQGNTLVAPDRFSRADWQQKVLATEYNPLKYMSGTNAVPPLSKVSYVNIIIWDKVWHIFLSFEQNVSKKSMLIVPETLGSALHVSSKISADTMMFTK